MDTTSAPTTIDSLFASQTDTAAPPVAVPAPSSPELAPVTPPVSPDPTGTVSPQPQPAPVAQPPAQPAPQPQPHMVPLPELLETRRRAQAAEAQAQQQAVMVQQLMEALQRQNAPQQPQPQPIDPIAEPERAYQALQQTMAQQLQAVERARQEDRQFMQMQMLSHRADISEHAARGKHGHAAVDSALQAAQAAGLGQVFMHKADPYAELMSWHQGQQLAQRIGNDPAAYEAQIRERARQELMLELRQGKPAPSNVPPSLSSATNSAAAPGHVASDKDFFNSMFGRRPPRQG